MDLCVLAFVEFIVALKGSYVLFLWFSGRGFWGILGVFFFWNVGGSPWLLEVVS